MQRILTLVQFDIAAFLLSLKSDNGWLLCSSSSISLLSPNRLQHLEHNPPVWFFYIKNTTAAPSFIEPGLFSESQMHNSSAVLLMFTSAAAILNYEVWVGVESLTWGGVPIEISIWELGNYNFTLYSCTCNAALALGSCQTKKQLMHWIFTSLSGKKVAEIWYVCENG